MSDLLSSSEKLAISLAFDDLHDTFARDIRVFIKTLTTHSGVSSGSNSLWDRAKPVSPTEESVSVSTITARLKFMDKAELEKIPVNNTATNLSFPNGVIRLKVKDEDYNTVKKSVKIEYGGLPYKLYSDAGKIGPFNVNYFTLYFVRADI